MVLFIAKRGQHNIGAKTHIQALREIYGSENVYEVDLFSKDSKETDHYLSFGNDLRSISKRVQRYFQGNVPMISNQIIKKICSIIAEKNVSLVFTEESDLGNLYKEIKQRFSGVKIICFFHDILADLFAQRLKSVPFWKLHYILELKRGISQEKVTTRYVDECWTFHQKDSMRFKERYNVNSGTIIPLSSFVPSLQNISKEVVPSESEKIILFVCSSYFVNIDGFRWFYQNVLPHLKKNYKLLLVGSGSDIFNKLNKEYNMEVVGRVDSLEEYYINADIVIAPVFDGGGMKVKTLEALSYGKCIVSTSESLNGFWEKTPSALQNKLIFRCNTSDEWINACNSLLQDNICKFNNEIYDLFAEHFSYECMLEQFRQALA